ncbi:MAG: hypothetical protein MK105_00595 [Crocinitomicaceae bacterium]|nr:hypothetical protein [Crocinitomicaceae bacterium]
MSNPRIAIISDLWGFKNDQYINTYVKKLYNHFDLDLVDAQVLADINPSNSEQELHAQFIDSGINIAAERLVKSRIRFDAIVGFSVGGTIGWKAIQSGANIDSLFAISATRLRKETNALTKETKLFYGQKEEFGPDTNWFEKLKIDHEIIQNEGHQVYKSESFMNNFCEELIDKYSGKQSCS